MNWKIYINCKERYEKNMIFKEFINTCSDQEVKMELKETITTKWDLT